jgi:hypothetical protein
MTRDEAIKIFSEKKIGKDWEIDWIDKLAALGVLKLDEPKSVTEKLVSAVCDDGWPRSTADTMLRFIERANLKLAEK